MIVSNAELEAENVRLRDEAEEFRHKFWEERLRNSELQAKLDLVDLRFAKLDFTPGDVLIFKTDVMLTKEQMTQLRDRINEQVPVGIKWMLVTSGIGITKLRKKLKWKSAWEAK